MDAHAPLPGSRIRPGSESSGLCLRNFTFTVKIAPLRPAVARIAQIASGQTEVTAR